MNGHGYGPYNNDWKRSSFTEGPYYNTNRRWTRSLTDIPGAGSVNRKPGYHENLPRVLPGGFTNDVHNKKPYDDYATEYSRNLSSETDSTEVIQEKDDTNPNRSFCNIMSRFAERTSCVGPPYINSANHFYSKFFWSVVFVGMLAATAANLYLNVETFYSRPVKTTLSIGYSSLVFPMVTFCNMNPVRKSQLHLARQDLQEFVNLQDPSGFERPPPGQGPPNSPPGRKKRFVDEFQRSMNGGNRTFRPHPDKVGQSFGGEVDPRFESQEEFTYLIGLEKSKTRFNMSHQAKDMVMSCSFEGRTCEVENFTRFLTDDFGACYSFNRVNFVNKDRPLRKSYRSGNKYGLQLMLFLQVDEYISGVAQGYGVRVGVSYPKTMAFPTTDGMYVSAGTETDIGVKMINITRLKAPYASNCEAPAAFVSDYGFEYSRQACQAACPHAYILETCGCYDPSAKRLYPINMTANYNACKTDEEFECMEDIDLQFTVEQTLTCDCPSPCSEVTYDTLLSSREWPEDGYMHALIDKVCRTAGMETSCDALVMKEPAEQRRNFLKMNIFYRDLNFESVVEEPDYPESQFLSDIGGSIGLWVGLSVISVVEVLELGVQIFVWFCRRCMQTRRRNIRRRNTLQDTSIPPKRVSGDSITPQERHRGHSDFRGRTSGHQYRQPDTLW